MRDEKLEYDAADVPRYAFCESSAAGSLSKWHIRPITPGVGLKLGGGIDSDGICGRPRVRVGGWDLTVRIRPMWLRSTESRSVCRTCRDELLRRWLDNCETRKALGPECGNEVYSGLQWRSVVLRDLDVSQPKTLVDDLQAWLDGHGERRTVDA